MEKWIRFQRDADVQNENGEGIGLLERVVLNPESMVVTDLVVRTGRFLGKKEKVLPIDMVLEAGEYLVVVRDDKEQLEHLPLFEEKLEFFDIEELEHPHSDKNVPPPILGYLGSTPLSSPKRDEKFFSWTIRNIPEGTVAVKEGARVIAVGGKYIGTVEGVLADPRADQVTHLQISNGLLSKETILIPIHWVKSLGEDEVHLKVRKDSIEEAVELSALD